MTQFGGELVFGDTCFWLSHDAYLDMEHILRNDGVFVFRGAVRDGSIAERWSGTTPTLGEFHPDPERPCRLSASREARLDDATNAIHRDGGFALLMENQYSGCLDVIELGSELTRPWLRRRIVHATRPPTTARPEGFEPPTF